MARNHKDQSRRDPKTGRYTATVLSSDQLETVRRLGLIGATVAEVAVVLNIPYDTLDQWTKNQQHPFTENFHKGRLEGNVTLRRKMFQLATTGEGNPTMLIWMSKNLLGWSDSPQVALNVNATANAHADARSPEQVKRELVDLQKAVFLEAKRLNGNN